ncbi:methyltransferase domain-containing protein [Pseudomonas sp. NPDC087614]|uniref:methyltransferase domain-containing protein n=1 Tax=Pseudomonas sp. NPDC087614 TaxID=3364442 RepID=UPI0037F5AA46
MNGLYKRFNSARNIFLGHTGIRRIANALRYKPVETTFQELAATVEEPLSTEEGTPKTIDTPINVEHETAQNEVEVMQIATVQSDQPDVLYSFQPGTAIKVLFVAQHPSIWASWRSIWQAMKNDPAFVAKVVLSPFLHPYSSSAVTMDNMRRCLIEAGVPFCTAEALNLENFRPHVVFLQNPYDETRPDFLRSENLTRAGSRVAYVPYGLEMGGGAWNLTAQFDLPIHRIAWRIFARSERHKKMFAKYCRSGNSHVVVTGHPKFDQINYNLDQSLPEETTNKIDGRKVILWTPHFSVTEIPSWSTYRIYNDVIFSTFAQQQDIFLLLRPHPLFFKSMVQNGLWDETGETQFREKIKNSKNIALDESSDYHPAFSLSDALMSDVGSFLLEYLPTGKPLLYLHHPDGLGMNDDEAVTKSLYRATSNRDITDFVDIIKNDTDSRKAERDSIKSEYLFGLEDNIGANICRDIVSSLTTGDTWFPRLRDEKSTLQQRSEEYWENATTTYLAPPDYYEKKAVVLDEELPKLGSPISAIDIGCGDGKFTLQLAKYVKRIQAYDISPELIEKARENALNAEANNVVFIQQEIDCIVPFEKFDVVSCMGVTSCIIDDSKFIFFLQKLRELSKTAGDLLMIDTISTANEQNAEDQSGYLAKYRSIEDYKILFRRAGFAVQREITITEVKERNLTNKLFIMKPCDL